MLLVCGEDVICLQLHKFIGDIFEYKEVLYTNVYLNVIEVDFSNQPKILD